MRLFLLFLSMSHNHNHNNSIKNIRVAFMLNVLFTLVEIIGGILTNSVAIMSDAVHDLGDSLSLGLAWYFQNLSKKGRDHNYSYGYKRFSLLGALINGVILLLGSGFILFKAVPRLINPEVADAQGMIYIAVFGIIVNGAAAFKLMTGKTLNERVVYLHLLEDVLGWIAVLIGAVVMYFFDIPIIDPILSVLISLYMLFNVIKNLRKTLKVLLQAVPIDVDMQKIEAYLKNHELIEDYHDLHVWSMDGTYNILTVHIVLVDDISTAINPKNEIKRGLVKLGIEHPTIEIHEKGDEDCDLED